MHWTSIRLELAGTPDFPKGSASRAYLIRLPLHEDGLIDAHSLTANPARATIRRHWPNQPDRSGYIVPTPAGWTFSYEPGEADGEKVFQLESHQLRIGARVTLTEPDGSRLPYRVTDLRVAD